MPEGLHIERNGPTSLRVSGEVDLANAEDLAAAFEGLENQEEDVELDLGGLTFIDSTGIRQLILLARRLPPGRSLVIRAPTAAVRRTFEIAGIPDIPQIRLADDHDASG